VIDSLAFIDKKKRLRYALENDALFLELGSGSCRQYDYKYITVDISDHCEVDVVGDVFKILGNIPSSSCRGIVSSHLIEHLANPDLFLRECVRILKPGCSMQVIAPHFSNPYFYSDPTHSTSYGLYTFAYYFKCTLFSRLVPGYCCIPGASLCRVRLSFKSPRPFILRYGLKKILELIVNSSIYALEIYEELFLYLFPCYEIIALIKKDDDET
jgi:SAM-dependent methyltransferase